MLKVHDVTRSPLYLFATTYCIGKPRVLLGMVKAGSFNTKHIQREREREKSKQAGREAQGAVQYSIPQYSTQGFRTVQVERVCPLGTTNASGNASGIQ